MRYDLESTLPERAFKKSLFKNAPATLEGGKGGGGGAPTQTTSTSNVSNIPEYAQPYVENMLGATQKQLFTMDDSGGITGFQPYKAYGGTYDAQGNQTGYDPSKAVAGFSPMQQQAQQSAANLQTPGQFGAATGLTGIAGMGSLQAGQNFQNMATDPNAIQSYMNPYLQASLNPQLAEIQRQYGVTGQQQAGQATQAGAFGGGRDAVMAAENERNKNTAMNQAIGQGYNTAFNNAQQQMNTGAQLNLQGLNQAGQAGSSLANIGSGQLAAQQGILGTQNQLGGQQQANQQQVINQSMQDYANAQQYPIMQLGTMSNMLRGLPMQAQTTQQYQAQANPITQGIGALGAGASLYNATKAEGGVIKAAKGGIMSYDVGGAVYSDLLDMEPEQLNKYIKEASSPRVKSMAEQVLREKTGKAGGGIMRYAEGDVIEARKSGLAAINSLPSIPSDYKGSLSQFMNSPEGKEYYKAKDIAKDAVVSNTPLSDIEKTNLNLIKNVPPVVPVKENVTSTTLPPDLAEQEKAYFNAPNAFGRKDGQPPTIVQDKNVKQPNVIQDKNSILSAKPPVQPPVQPIVKPPVQSATTTTTDNENLEKPPVLEQDKRGLADYIKEIRDQTPANLGNQEARSKAMAERANAADEAKRATNMRMAEFFAAWGSTPGNTIVAGLNALKNKIPDMIGDAKEANKIRRDIDKDIVALDRIDREEELGTIKDARAARQKVADNAQLKYGHELTSYASLISSKRQSESARYVADQNLKGHLAQAQATASRGSGGNYRVDTQALNQAIRGKQAEIGLIDKELKEDYLYGPSKTFLSNPNNKTKDPEKWKVAEDYVNRITNEHKTRLAPFDDQIGYYKERLGHESTSNTPTQNAPQTPMYATNGKERIVSNDGGKTWQPVGGK